MAFMARLLRCERRTEHFIRVIRELQREVRALQQQLREARGT
jgi:hypothetical protein